MAGCTALTGVGDLVEEHGAAPDAPDANGDPVDSGGTLNVEAGVVEDATPDSRADDLDTGTADAGDAGPFALLVRCGAGPGTPLYTDSLGRVWRNDFGFDTGLVITNNDSIAGTPDPALYHTERYADRFASPAGLTYAFDNVPPGNYVVKLRFVETSGGTVTGPNQRRFNVVIDGTEVLTAFDIFAAAGARGIAVDRSFPVTLQAPPLVIKLTPGAIQNPKINAIEVLGQ